MSINASSENGNKMRKKISIVSPCFNEETNVTECYNVIKHIFETQLIDYDREHIFCDNASTDKTLDLLKELSNKDHSVKVIVNSRNFGILRNTFNGVISASGDAVILFMPVDLQDPPELIPEFVKHWEAGNEIVYGIRARREENFLIRKARHLYYKIISYLSYVEYPPNVGDYQLIDKCVLNAMKRIDDAQPFMRMMTFDCGFKSIGIEYTWRRRKQGVSRNRFMQLIDQGLNGLISYSNTPIRISLFAGFFISGASILYAITIFFMGLFGLIKSQSGIPTLIVAIFFFAGVQLFFLGVIGEYIMAIFNQVRRRPIVIERERVNF